jgi:methylmalonyl-CoA/ethylmalonyl-CoA epimerase
MSFEFDHIGIAVRSLEEGAKFYRALGWQESSAEEVKSEKVQVMMFEFQNQSRIELLEPTTSDSVIAKFLEKRGPGIHHVCMRVKNIEPLLIELKAKGIRLVHEKPFLGAHNCKVAFVHPSSTGGVLLELSESGGNS